MPAELMKDLNLAQDDDDEGQGSMEESFDPAKKFEALDNTEDHKRDQDFTLSDSRIMTNMRKSVKKE